jgi:hypothetical protein
MDTNYLDGKHYRERAEECRVVAQILATAETHGTNQQFCYVLSAQMLKVAADYERIAEIADKLTDDAAESQVQSLLR